MVHLSWLFFILFLVLAAVFGGALWDILWTAIVPDHMAEVHFGRVSTRRRLVWLLIGLLIIISIVGWIR